MAASEADQTRLEALRLALWQALQGSGLDGLATLPLSALEVLHDQGLAHDHIRLGDTELLARLPKQSQWQHSPADNLAYQAHCFRACVLSGATPKLQAVLPVSAALPYGALLVDFIAGRRARLPDDLPAIARCLARLHASPLGAEATALQDQCDLLAANRAELDRQMAYLDRYPLADEARALLLALRSDLDACMPHSEPKPRHIIANDTHPGNYILRDGQAVLVDLEKAALGNPGIDLAHASAYTSTTWEPQGAARLDLGQVRAFYAHYLALVAPEQAECIRPWLLPARRLLYMRALSWCLMWLCELDNQRSGWSQKRSQSSVVAHFRGRAQHFLQPETLAWIDSELQGLEESLCP